MFQWNHPGAYQPSGPPASGDFVHQPPLPAVSIQQPAGMLPQSFMSPNGVMCGYPVMPVVYSNQVECPPTTVMGNNMGWNSQAPRVASYNHPVPVYYNTMPTNPPPPSPPIMQSGGDGVLLSAQGYPLPAQATVIPYGGDADRVSRATHVNVNPYPTSQSTESTQEDPLHPRNIREFSRSHCLLCGAGSHTYTACGDYDGRTVCIFLERDSSVHAMRHPSWEQAACMDEVVHFIETEMKQPAGSYELWLDGVPLPRSLGREEGRRVLCSQVRLLPGNVLFVASVPGRWSVSTPYLGTAPQGVPTMKEARPGVMDGDSEIAQGDHTFAASSSMALSTSQAEGRAAMESSGTLSAIRERDLLTFAPPLTPSNNSAKLVEMGNSAYYHSEEGRRSRTLHLKFIPSTMAFDELRQLLNRFGEIHRVRIVRPRSTTDPKKMFYVAFVEYASQAEAATAVDGLFGYRLGSQFYVAVEFSKHSITGGYVTDYDADTGKPCTFGLSSAEIRSVDRQYSFTFDRSDASPSSTMEGDSSSSATAHERRGRGRAPTPNAAGVAGRRSRRGFISTQASTDTATPIARGEEDGGEEAEAPVDANDLSGSPTLGNGSLTATLGLRYLVTATCARFAQQRDESIFLDAMHVTEELRFYPPLGSPSMTKEVWRRLQSEQVKSATVWPWHPDAPNVILQRMEMVTMQAALYMHHGAMLDARQAVDHALESVVLASAFARSITEMHAVRRGSEANSAMRLACRRYPEWVTLFCTLDPSSQKSAFVSGGNRVKTAAIHGSVLIPLPVDHQDGTAPQPTTEGAILHPRLDAIYAFLHHLLHLAALFDSHLATTHVAEGRNPVDVETADAIGRFMVQVVEAVEILRKACERELGATAVGKSGETVRPSNEWLHGLWQVLDRLPPLISSIRSNRHCPRRQ